MAQKNLIIDIGNTQAKLVLFVFDEIVSIIRTENSGQKLFDAIQSILFENMDCNCIISSVLIENKELIRYLRSSTKTFVELDSNTKLPIEIVYETPNTLGKDRIAAVVGAHNILAKTNVLVIDIGTAITYDFINSKSQYLGGNIAPGIRLRLQALHQFTSKLPIVEPSEIFNLTGKSTETAIRGGVMMGVLLEIEGYIRHYEQIAPKLQVILTGGDMFYFAEKLKNTTFAEPNLVPIGLNSILSYYNETTL